MTPTELCNVALGHIGQARIADIGERSPAAEHCRRMFDHVRRLCLRDHDWNFAVRRAALTALDAAPPFGFAAAYQLPADCLRVLAINGQPAGVRGTQWEVEGRTVLINADIAQLRYIADADDVTQWDSIFASYFSYRLAAAVAPSLRLDPQAGLQLEQMAAAVRSSAQEADNVETAPRVTRLDQSEIIQERGGWPAGTASGTSTGNAAGTTIGWANIAVAGQATVAASLAGDTFTLVAGTNVTIATNAATKTITIAASGGGGGGVTDLSMTRTANAVTIVSSTGTDAEIPQANDSHAGVMPADAHVKLSALPTAAALATSLAGKADAIHTHTAADISDSTAAGRAILTAADAAAQRTALELGTLATQSGTFSGTSSGTNTGNVTLATSVSSVLTLSGQQLQAVTDPASDRILFYDQSASAWAYASLGDSLVMTGTTLSVSLGTPGPIGGTTPGEGTFNQINARTGIDVQATVGSGGPLRVYNTPTTAPADYERGRIEWVSGVLTIGTESIGSGTAKAMALQTAGVTRVAIGATGLISINGATTPTNTPLSVKAVNPSSANHTAIRIERDGATSSIVEIGGTPSNNGLINIISASSGTIALQVDNTHFPVNVGIGRGTGSFSPAGRLHVRGPGSSTTVICRFENASATARFIVLDNGSFAFNATPTAVETGWTTFTNLTTNRTCDANATTVEELADILGTLIVALKDKGIISA